MRVSCNLSLDLETAENLRTKAAELNIGPSALANGLLRAGLALDTPKITAWLKKLRDENGVIMYKARKR